MGIFLGDMPYGGALVFQLVVGPSEDCAAPGLELDSQVLPVPLCKFLVIVGGLEHAADSSDLRHEPSD